MYHKHYYRLDEDGTVIFAFSDAFQQPEESDFYVEDGGRHFNPPIINGRGQYIYRLVSGEIVERTEGELDEEWESRPVSQTPEQRLEQLEQVVADLASLQLGV